MPGSCRSSRLRGGSRSGAGSPGGYGVGVVRQRAPLDPVSTGLPRHVLLVDDLLLRLGTGVVVGELDADVACIFALAAETLPEIILAAAGDDDGLEIDPGLADDFCLLVLAEDGEFEFAVVE